MKKIIALLLWLGGSIACAQSIQGVSPSTSAPDGSNVTAAKVLTYPQVQPTIIYNLSPTPSPVSPQPTQVSAWFQLNGNGAAMPEFSTNAFIGRYGVQTSDNPTPVSTPGTNIYTEVQDSASAASGAEPTQTLNWSYILSQGHKWMRLFCIPETTNTGTLDTQVRLFGNPAPGDAQRTYSVGVPWKGSQVVADTSASAVTETDYFDYKLPYGSKGFKLFTNVSALSGAMTITTTIAEKDPRTGILQPIAVGVANHATGFSTIIVAPGYASPYPVATPQSGQVIYSQSVGQDVVIENSLDGTGSLSYTQTAHPIQ